MTARTPQLRKKTAAEVAQKLGVSPRTVRRYVAALRDWWTQQRRELRQKAVRLRATGMTRAEVGKALGVSESSARAMGCRGAASGLGVGQRWTTTRTRLTCSKVKWPRWPT